MLGSSAAYRLCGNVISGTNWIRRSTDCSFLHKSRVQDDQTRKSEFDLSSLITTYLFNIVEGKEPWRRDNLCRNFKDGPIDG